MGQWFGGIRGESQARQRGSESKGIAFSRYYNEAAARGLHLRGADNWPIERAVVEGYERVIWVFKSVNTIATDSAGLPYRLRQGGEVIDDHPLYRVLNKKANKIESGLVFRKRLSSQVMLSKPGAFVHRVKSNGGTVKELHLLPPDRTELIPGTNGGIDHWRMTRRDGSYKNFDPDEVLWFRDPHPVDPFGGVTSLQAAGTSVQLDYFARLYNVSFMQNDGRPGGVLAVKDTAGGTDIDPKHMDRIESRFGKGPVEAGKLSVIAGELSYIDLATRPRDMQYGATSANAKTELLAAFGMSEVVLGNASGRTFDNADAEMYNYWTRTIPAHNRILLDGFDDDSGDDLEGFFDTSSVEVLERAEKAKREEARTEVAAGLRSPRSYAVLAGFGDEVEDTVFTRSLYLANGKTPLPTKTEDIAALGLDQGSGSGTPAVEGGVTPGDGSGVDPAALAAAPATPGLSDGATGAPAAIGAPEVPTVQGVDMAALAIKALPAGGGAGPKAPVVHFAYSLSRKAAPWNEDADGEAAQRALEAELSTALGMLAERWVERTLTRTQSPKQRKGTRHWTPEYERDTRLGTKALDAAKAADEETWEREAEEEVTPIVTNAAVAAAVALLASIDVVPLDGESLREMAERVVRRTVIDVVSLIGRSAARQARIMAGLINGLDQSGVPMDQIADAIRERGRKVQEWTDGVAIQGATATVNGARDAAAEEVDDDESIEVQREWVTRLDDRVRPTHRVAHNQRRALRQPFVVGDSLLRFPGDPLAPIHETANCRCRLRYRSRRTGRYVSMDTLVGAVNQ